MREFLEDKQERRLAELHREEAEALAQVLAQRHALPYLDLSRVAINADALALVPEAEARSARLAIFHAVGKKLDLALTNPDAPAAQALIEDLRGKNFKPELYLVSLASLERAWERYADASQTNITTAGVIEIDHRKIGELATKLQNRASVEAAVEAEGAHAAESGISDLLEIILAGAIALGASDLHLEPEEESIRLRYRLDGVLNNIATLRSKIYSPILSRLKIVSGLKLNVRKAAQDGRFSLKTQAGDYDIRASILPGAFGESVVLRLLNPDTLAVSFTDLGIESNLLAKLEKEIKKPNGLILLTGPTGAGKTTTLYAILREINAPGNKIITIEDPIEYHLEGINQTQVDQKKGYTFLSGLRSALRQDPDIIMVGEIRDGETATIAINSALTGHLVLSTLHTNNAWGTIPRLIDLGINPKVLESALNVAVAQRLVRRLCPDCRVEKTLSAAEQDFFGQILAAIAAKRPDLARPTPKVIWQAAEENPPGGKNTCDHCHGTGYRGRVGLFEAMLMDESVARQLTANPSARELRSASLAQGILEMMEDGVIKVLDGVTTMAELERVVGDL